MEIEFVCLLCRVLAAVHATSEVARFVATPFQETEGSDDSKHKVRRGWERKAHDIWFTREKKSWRESCREKKRELRGTVGDGGGSRLSMRNAKGKGGRGFSSSLN